MFPNTIHGGCHLPCICRGLVHSFPFELISRCRPVDANENVLWRRLLLFHALSRSRSRSTTVVRCAFSPLYSPFFILYRYLHYIVIFIFFSSFHNIIIILYFFDKKLNFIFFLISTKNQFEKLLRTNKKSNVTTLESS